MASWPNWLADRLTEPNHKFVYLYPVLPIKKPQKLVFCLSRCLALDYAQSIGDSVDVSVDWDCRFAETVYQDAVGSLPPNQWEFQQAFQFSRYFSPVLFHDSLGHFSDLSSLDVIEACWTDQMLHSS